MKTKIYISKDAWLLTKKITQFIINELIFVGHIDTLCYEIKINNVNYNDSSEYMGYNIYIDYDLIETEVKKQLEQSEERLQIGL